MSLSRGKDLSTKDEKIKELEFELTAKTSEVSALEKDWKEAKSKLTKDATIRRLMRQNDQFKGTFGKLALMYKNCFCLEQIEAKEREFEAFKEHSNNLLERERHLNKRLRSYSLKPDE